MASSLTVDIFVSVDEWAGSDGLPEYFGYLNPQLEEWIMAELAAPQLVVMRRRTYQALAGLPVEAHGKSWGRRAPGRRYAKMSILGTFQPDTLTTAVAPCRSAEFQVTVSVSDSPGNSVMSLFCQIEDCSSLSPASS